MSGARASAADRQRRFRKRQRYGLRSIRVEVDEHRTFALLIAAGYLSETDDPDALTAGLERMIGDLQIVDEKTVTPLLSPARAAR
ncbi:hypothetical protein [Sphingosinicella microcystinivorans]|uniref:hypothetical protein n=1 Tax=Sphingosinicella microcystinivorans TaxID=335406 RepID=UPI0022F3D762|nr:hypothetical protein [Sphingosinicella microcystinivorans]WBX83012.1 hypothetical protein PE061_14490 [Sphingosinicella microcystinivorans]